MANQLDQVFDRVYPVVNAVTHVVQHKIPGSVVNGQTVFDDLPRGVISRLDSA